MTQQPSQSIQVPSEFLQILGAKELQIALLQREVARLNAELEARGEGEISPPVPMDRAARRRAAATEE